MHDTSIQGWDALMSISNRKLAIVSGFAWGFSFVAARILLEQPALTSGMRFVLAFGPSIPFVGLLVGVFGLLRKTDELERQIQVESFATAFGLTVLLITTLALAQKAGLASLTDFSFVHIMPMLFLFYLGGNVFARRRYICETE